MFLAHVRLWRTPTEVSCEEEMKTDSQFVTCSLIYLSNYIKDDTAWCVTLTDDSGHNTAWQLVTVFSTTSKSSRQAENMQLPLYEVHENLLHMLPYRKTEGYAFSCLGRMGQNNFIWDMGAQTWRMLNISTCMTTQNTATLFILLYATS